MESKKKKIKKKKRKEKKMGRKVNGLMDTEFQFEKMEKFWS